MNKAIATIATGPAAELLALALPRLQEYAERHGYDVVIGNGEAEGRAPAWAKVRLIRRMLDSYDLVLWIDADALILDTTRDIADEVDPQLWQAMVLAPAQSWQRPPA